MISDGDRITIRKPDDFHVHLRQRPFLKMLAHYTARQFARALVMPNTQPAVMSARDVVAYREEILEATRPSNFTPLMTIKLTREATPDAVFRAKEVGTLAVKYYPEGVTHNSSDGIADIRQVYPVIEAMEHCGMVLSVHAEHPGRDVFCLDREERFIDTLYDLAEEFPRLRIVVEHVTTEAMVRAVCQLPSNVAATITVHHLFLTLNDVLDGGLSPHHYCKPLAKRAEDRAALRGVALSGDPKFFLGTDSAPHPREAKECQSGCAGVFTAPVAMPLLAAFFEEKQRLAQLEPFTSEHGARFYGLPLNDEPLVLVRRRSPTVPPMIQGLVPFWHGKTIPWSLG